MRKLVNRYKYKVTFKENRDENGKMVFDKIFSNLSACHKNRDYLTKMKKEELPEYYCDVQRYACNHDLISSKGVADMKYKWFKENHFMKDSVLYVSFGEKINEVNDGIFINYENTDEMIFGHDIFKFLAYSHKYSNYDISEIKNNFIEQCNWLKENEPSFAPDLKDDDCDDYGQWFDKMLKSITEEYILK